MTGSIVYVFLFPNRVSFQEAFEVLEPDDGKLSRPVLRGPGLSNGVRLLDHICAAVSIHAGPEGVPLMGDSAASPLTSARCLVPFGVPIQKKPDKLGRRTETAF